MIFQLLSGRMIYFFLENMIFRFLENIILFFKRNMKDGLSQKRTWEYIFFKCPEKMVFLKNIALEYDLSRIIWNDDIFFSGKYYIFSLDGK